MRRLQDSFTSVNTCKIALIGVGRWGKNHYRVLSDLGCLAAVCDPRGQGALDAAGLGAAVVPVLQDVDGILADPSIQGVVVATPALTHVEVVERCLAAGKHVLCEKPIALTVAEGEALKAQAARLGLVLMVGHVLAYHPVVDVLQRLMRGGALGRVRYLYSNRLNMGVIRNEENALWSFAPHDLALCALLLGRLPERVSCQGQAYLSEGIADVTLTSLDFGSGLKGHIFVSWLHPFKEQRFVIVGEKEMAVFDDRAPWESKLMLYAHEVEWIDGQTPKAKPALGRPIPLTQREPLQAQAEHFIASIEQGASPRTDAAHAVEVLRMLEAAQKSLETGGVPVSLDRRAPERAQERASYASRHVDLAGASEKARPLAMRGPSEAATPSAPEAGDDSNAGVYIHASAVVDAGARIGRGTKVWHFAHVMGSAIVGEGCTLGQGVFVGANVRLGRNVKLQNHVSVFDGVTLEDDVFCGPSLTFTNVKQPRSDRPQGGKYAATHVGRGATLGANATIVCGVRIGAYAFVGAGAVVTRDVPAFALVYGAPARVQGWVCYCGARLNIDGGPGGPPVECEGCGTQHDRAHFVTHTGGPEVAGR